MLPDTAQGDDHRQADGQTAECQGGPALVADDRAPGKPLLETEQDRERHPGHPCGRRQDERDEHRRDQQDRVNDQGLDHAGAIGATWPYDHADKRDRNEDGGEPAQAGALP